ncbi:ComEA family DNA-binding protein [Crenobacter cavernae]|uniref:Topoisomerase n=1 Tax=Crenobacter cavernae TaxID=2290923 RepID=A0A345Y397_9NEIS|nr:helix-hairpin-helix domain-containing protein [Crenobacter cavernae]AXK38399.1 topoisomerase [Crenobacter cavernae]
MKKLLAVVLSLFFFNIAFAAVNLNTANQQELEALNGIGPAKAKAILDYRTKNGPFKTVDDLKNVPGIGDKTLEKLRKDISTSGQTTLPAKPAGKPATAAKPATDAKPATTKAVTGAKPADGKTKPAAKPADGKAKPAEPAPKP